MIKMLPFYTNPSEFTDPKHFTALLKEIPDDLESVCQFVQNLLIHAYWFERYGCAFNEVTKLEEMQLRYIADILKLAESKNRQPVSASRNPQDRVVGICRDFSLMVCTILRAKDIPARLRCGFATYLRPGQFEDHWVCEYWNKAKSTWIMVDAQLDQLHRETLNIDFDPCDVPPNRFIVAGQAWELCQTGQENPDHFGINGFSGKPFIKGNIIRDLFALTKIEILAWDTGWGVLQDYITPIANDNEMAMLDELATISRRNDTSAAIEVLTNNPAIRLPDDWLWEQAPTLRELYSR
ncbi:transglutaminase domain-containing protein [Spongorhabdus nitratireducens]